MRQTLTPAWARAMREVARGRRLALRRAASSSRRASGRVRRRRGTAGSSAAGGTPRPAVLCPCSCTNSGAFTTAASNATVPIVAAPVAASASCSDETRLSRPSRTRASAPPSRTPSARPRARLRTGRGANGASASWGWSSTLTLTGEPVLPSGVSRRSTAAGRTVLSAAAMCRARCASESVTVARSSTVSATASAVSVGLDEVGTDPRDLPGDGLGGGAPDHDVGVGLHPLLREQAAGVGRTHLAARGGHEEGDDAAVARSGQRRQQPRREHADHDAGQDEAELHAQDLGVVTEVHE